MLSKVWKKIPTYTFPLWNMTRDVLDPAHEFEKAGDAGDMGLISGSEDPLEKEMATHSSVPAWRIPGTGEPRGLPSMGSHRVGHD